MAEARPAPATQTILSPKGVPLVDAGHRFAPALNEALARHKLLAAAEEDIAPGEEITPAGLVQAADELLVREPIFADLMPGAAEHRQFVHALSALQLSERMTIKLSVTAKERPELLTHGLRAAFCAAALAQRLHLPRHEVAEAIAAGLFHDLGLLHVDPALLQKGRQLDEHERHYVDAHPLTGYLMLEGETAWHPVVSTAVLEHHERIDGSGYPRGLGGNRLGQLGQLLAVAELAATLLTADSTALSWLRLGVILRLNENKLNHAFCNSMLEAFPHTGVPKFEHRDLGAVLEILVNLAIAFKGWSAASAPHAELPVVAFVESRIDRLRRNLADVGIDLKYWLEFDADIERDARSLNEIKLAAREGLWQLSAIVDETRRRWERLQPVPPEVLAWLDGVAALPR